MFTWICKPLACCVALIGLAGCLAAPVTSQRDTRHTTGLRSVAVADKSVVIGGPDGYCIDKTASRLRGDTAFILLGSCTIISGDDHDAVPQVPGILTASIDQKSAATVTPRLLDQFAGFVISDAGRAVLARDGRTESVTVQGVLRERDAVLIHLTDTSAFQIPGIEPTYWRGIFALNGRLISASVLGFQDHPLGPTEGLATLEAFLEQIRTKTSLPLVAADGVAKEPIPKRIRRRSMIW
ncbi:hypothetical protein [Ascidiaceihabitans sp.]|uniref:hypothetical protein n=1 Tax=Ascidiaceihabitans sp. TaxID=1872644 RepID=UPI0032990358